MYERICRICEEPFRTARSNSAFCVKEHKKPCKNCKKEYLVKKVVNPPEFCSGSCSAQYRSSKGLVYKTCKFCGDIFSSVGANSRYCTKDHYQNCKNCGNEFLIINMSRRKDYCSRQCTSISKAKVKSCKRCGEEFVAIGKQIYCDRPHYSSCEYCGKEILEKLAKRVSRFCSGSCSTLSRPSDKVFTCLACGDFFSSPVSWAKYCRKEHTKLCTVCDKEYVYNPYKESYSCSKKCASELIDFDERSEKTVKTLQETYGVSNAYQMPHVVQSMIDAGVGRVSKLNLRWQKNLEAFLGVGFDLEVKFGGDFYADLGRDNLVIEINPAISHNSSENFLHLTKRCDKVDCGHKPLLEDYHLGRVLAAEAEGKTLLQFFDWYDEEVFMSIVRSKLLLNKNCVEARETSLQEISKKDANMFFKENHLLGVAERQTVCIGLFVSDVLVHVNTYGPSRLNKNCEWEAIRSASKMNWSVEGGFSKCDSYFFNTRNPRSVTSYVDLSISTGCEEFMFPGWELKSLNKPSATWVNISGDKELPEFVKENSAGMFPVDSLAGFDVDAKYFSHLATGNGFSVDDVLLAEGYVKVFDAGTRTFIWSP